MSGKGASKKTVEKAKQKVLADQTFGLKNKSKSKTVQKHIQQLTATIAGQKKKEGPSEGELRKQRKLEQKEREKELKMLFKVVETKKTNTQTTEEQDDSSSESEEDTDDYTQLTLEEIIEKERKKIKNGIPVTLETFEAWRADKQRKKEEAERQKHIENVARYRKSGSGVTGRALFDIDAAVFVDDEEAVEAVAYEYDRDAALEDDVPVDESLFALDDEEQEGQEVVERSFDPATWQGKSPKELLLEFIQAHKIRQTPQYVKAQSLPGTHSIKVVLPHLKNMEFLPILCYPNAKLAEQNAALMAFDYLVAEEAAAAAPSSSASSSSTSESAAATSEPAEAAPSEAM